MAEWDPQKFIITVGANNVVGFASGTFIKASFNEDQYTLEVGADGSGCRIRNANRSGKFEVTLLKSSPSNDVLSAQAAIDAASGRGCGPIQVKDNNGAAVASCENGWIVKPADLERGKELGDVTWTFETLVLEITQGGIAPLDGPL